ncbi:MAG: HAMP domain-containing protein [Chloroflexi bacterium]|nr:HAMP domain-containing protein [Chloroflexota bacterium]MBT4073580.1 HAMP domain-containing protein [Chloroflexota bacterium]MBT4514999.1 HAMP domain-containing protein [Chloroflexota bacterium]MBT5319064.1 HAMP domain-containing protein [Chloroflexota bacterium]MBT6681410.1 HAMP domain-containing protein [Chloroflexota bacterium]
MRLSNIGLQFRIMAYVFVGLTILVSLFGYVALQAVDDSSEEILQERLILARTVASAVDRTVITTSTLVTGVAESMGRAELEDPGDAENSVATLALALTDVNAGTPPELVVLIDGDGDAIVRSGESRESGALLAFAAVLQPGNPPSVVGGGAGGPLIAVASELAGDTGGARIAAVILPSPQLLEVSSAATGDVGSYRTELIDANGIVLETSDGDRPLTPTRHLAVIGDALKLNDIGVGEHTPPHADGGETERHVVAFAPLQAMPWGIVVEQPEDVALAVPNDLRRRILWIAGLGFLSALGLAWLTSRQVVRPLTRLTERAHRIASGDLGGTIPPEGQDEIRRLSESFEVMRDRLQVSQLELEEWSGELEDRVAERTAELGRRSSERDLLLQKVMTAQEEERKRIARDLHDQIGQSLTALTMSLGSAEAELETSDPDTSKRIGELRLSAGDTIEEVRRMMGDLRPSVLDDMGLSAAIGWYLENQLERTGVKSSLDVSELKAELPNLIEITAFRVVQEALNNIVKHAHAGQTTVRLSGDDRQISGEITDDGDGFDMTTVEPSADGGWAVGLLGMNERVTLLGGSLDIDTAPGEGTSVRFVIPLAQEVVSG